MIIPEKRSPSFCHQFFQLIPAKFIKKKDVERQCKIQCNINLLSGQNHLQRISCKKKICQIKCNRMQEVYSILTIFQDFYIVCDLCFSIKLKPSFLDQKSQQVKSNFIAKFIISMNCMRELPQEYIDLCPTIDQKYKVVFKLGSGRFSKVKMGINMVTNQRVAIKIMNQKIEEAECQRGYQQQVLKMFLNEVKMSHEARHRNIVQIIDFNVGGVYRLADGKVQRILYYVMKIEEYGELYRLISQTEQFSERTARHIFKQLLNALRHTHNCRIAHCDVKSENILLDSKFNVKVVDFGHARFTTDEMEQPINYHACDGVGSLKCNAPEITNGTGKGEYSAEEIDIFATGCFLFELVMKTQPFKSSNIKDEYYSKLANFQQQEFWEIFSGKPSPSTDFKDLIEKMLNPNPKERIPVQDIFKHPWIHGETLNRDEYRKEMNMRVKKVMVKIRKEQESEIKQTFLKEKGKKEMFSLDYFPIEIPRQCEEQIFMLRNLISIDDRSSHSDCSSHEEHEKGEVKVSKIKTSLSKKSSESSREETGRKES